MLAAVVVLLGCWPNVEALAAAPAPQASGTIEGRVVDSETGLPLEGVLVRVVDTDLVALTDAEGRFRLPGLEAGTRSLFVSFVGYALAKRDVEVTAAGATAVTIPLTPGTGTYTEEVTVTAEIFERKAAGAPSQHALGSAELQELRGVLADDPMRAVQVVPGVATGDDFRSEFSIRGSAPRHVGISYDGVPNALLVHLVQGVEDTGSVAMINSDVLDGVEISAGSYPQRFGNRLGAQVDFTMRQGSRDKAQVRGAVSGTNASLVLEGPLGSARRGSWLVSARQSYLDWLIRQIDPEATGTFGFTDMQGKLAYDLSARHQLQLTLVAGRSRLDENEEDASRSSVEEGVSRAGMLNASWWYAPSPEILVVQRAFLAATDYDNTNLEGTTLSGGQLTDAGYRLDVEYDPGESLELELGGDVRFLGQRALVREFLRPRGDPTQVVEAEFEERTSSQSAYGLVRWRPLRGFVIGAGGRLDRWSAIDQVAGSPWAQLEWQADRSTWVRFGAGIHRQSPTIEQVFGPRGSRDLEAERAWHVDVGVERRFGGSTRLVVGAYDREERDLLRLPDSEARVEDGVLRFGSGTSRWRNSMDGYSRGIEAMLQRRGPGRLSGWASYALGFTRREDRLAGEKFWGDWDQRHTLNLFGQVRISHRLALSSKLRVGSNFPLGGYYERRGEAYFVTDRRNADRLPTYARWDVRANTAFDFRRSRLTLFVEVLNLSNRDNLGLGDGDTIRSAALEVRDLVEELFPLLPSAGILVEF